MRGKENILTILRVFIRITPAYAGKSSRYGLFCAENKDHPRLCGEKKILAESCTCVLGSPPPMRGKVAYRSSRRFFPNSRITPAYAGKSQKSKVSDWVEQDHPRLCGEKQSDKMLRRCLEGSPPPMRGKAIALCSSPRWHRITPAYAGKSTPCKNVRYTSEDHPRLCGEKSFLLCFPFCQMGSPPPMRGKD